MVVQLVLVYAGGCVKMNASELVADNEWGPRGNDGTLFNLVRCFQARPGRGTDALLGFDAFGLPT